MNTPTDWGSALAILAAGLILGLIVFIASKRRKASAAVKRDELESRRDALVQQLRELGDDAPDEERTWIERETADVLRALDGLPAPKGVPSPAAEPSPRRPLIFGFAYGVLCTLVAGGIVYYGSTYATGRGEPVNVEERIAAAKDAFARNDLIATFEQTKAILDQHPDEPRALTYNAIVRMAMGEVASAKTQLEQATQLDPKLLDAWVALASARTQSGDSQGASAAIEKAIKEHPAEEQRLRDVYAQIQNQEKSARSDLPPDHPPIPDAAPPHGTAAMTAGTAPNSSLIHITLSADDPDGGIIYVLARGEDGGHPVAVQRIETNAFPLTVDFGGSDTMMGAPMPAKVRLEARLDADGDAGTTDPAELRAVANGVVAGSSVEMKLAKAE